MQKRTTAAAPDANISDADAIVDVEPLKLAFEVEISQSELNSEILAEIQLEQPSAHVPLDAGALSQSLSIILDIDLDRIATSVAISASALDEQAGANLPPPPAGSEDSFALPVWTWLVPIIVACGAMMWLFIACTFGRLSLSRRNQQALANEQHLALERKNSWPEQPTSKTAMLMRFI